MRDLGREVWPKAEQNPAALATKQKAEMEHRAPGIKVQ